jgi:hypothetical protein
MREGGGLVGAEMHPAATAGWGWGWFSAPDPTTSSHARVAPRKRTVGDGRGAARQINLYAQRNLCNIIAQVCHAAVGLPGGAGAAAPEDEDEWGENVAERAREGRGIG